MRERAWRRARRSGGGGGTAVHGGGASAAWRGLWHVAGAGVSSWLSRVGGSECCNATLKHATTAGAKQQTISGEAKQPTNVLGG
eukprot:scaffold43224_cov64-Phaeocystis_antarctica.AAC.2